MTNSLHMKDGMKERIGLHVGCPTGKTVVIDGEHCRSLLFMVGDVIVMLTLSEGSVNSQVDRWSLIWHAHSGQKKTASAVQVEIFIELDLDL